MQKFIIFFLLLFSSALVAQETGQDYDPNSCCYTFKEVYYKSGPFIGIGPRATSLGIDTTTNCYYYVSNGQWRFLSCLDGSGSGGTGSTELADGTTILGTGSANDPFRIDTTLMATRNYVDQKFDEVQLGQGPAGADGQEGKDAFEVWKEQTNNPTATFEDYLASITGPQGEAGPTGATGPIGPQGEIGPQGPAGADGQNGINCWDLDGDGVDDAEEDTNNDGLFNANDCKGIAGAQGPSGPIGPQGIRGPIGDTGLQGPKGDTGAGLMIQSSLNSSSELPSTGNPGDAYLINGDLWVWDETNQNFNNTGNIQGPQGETGPQGPAGADGQDSATGPQGPTGADGQDGTPCWDLDGDGINDAEEDTNNDGLFNTYDCLPDLSGLDDVYEGIGTPTYDAISTGQPWLYLDTLNGDLFIFRRDDGWRPIEFADNRGLYSLGNNGQEIKVSNIKINKETTVDLQQNAWRFDQLDYKVYLDGNERKFRLWGSGMDIVFEPDGVAASTGTFWKNRGGGSGTWQNIIPGDIKTTTSYLGLPIGSSFDDVLLAVEDSIGKADEVTLLGSGRTNDRYRIDTNYIATRDYVDQNVCKYNITIGTETDGAFIQASEPNVTYTRNANVVDITKPAGTKICNLVVRGASSNHPGQDHLYVNIDYQGETYNQNYLTYKGVAWEVWNIGQQAPGDTIGSQWLSHENSAPYVVKSITKVQGGKVTTKSWNVSQFSNYMVDFTKL